MACDVVVPRATTRRLTWAGTGEVRRAALVRGSACAISQADSRTRWSPTDTRSGTARTASTRPAKMGRRLIAWELGYVPERSTQGTYHPSATLSAAGRGSHSKIAVCGYFNRRTCQSSTARRPSARSSGSSGRSNLPMVDVRSEWEGGCHESDGTKRSSVYHRAQE